MGNDHGGNDILDALPSDDAYVDALKANLNRIRESIQKYNQQYSGDKRWNNILQPQLNSKVQDIEAKIVKKDISEIVKKHISEILRQIEDILVEPAIAEIEKDNHKTQQINKNKNHNNTHFRINDNKENTDDIQEFICEPRQCPIEEREEEKEEEEADNEPKYKIWKLSTLQKQSILDKYPFLQQKFGTQALEKIKHELCIIYDYPLKPHTKAWKSKAYNVPKYELSAKMLHEMDILFLWCYYTCDDIQTFLINERDFNHIKSVQYWKQNNKAFGNMHLWLTGSKVKQKTPGTCIFCQRPFECISAHYHKQRKHGLICMTYNDDNERVRKLYHMKTAPTIGNNTLYFNWKLTNPNTGFILTIPNKKNQKFCESVFGLTFVKPFLGDIFESTQQPISIKNSKNEIRDIIPDWYGYFQSNTEKYLLVLLYNEHGRHYNKKFIEKETQDAIDLASTKQCKVLQCSVYPWKHTTESGTCISSTFKPNSRHIVNGKIQGVNIEQSNKFYGCLLKLFTDIIKDKNKYGFKNLKQQGKFKDDALILYIGCSFGHINPLKRQTDIIIDDSNCYDYDDVNIVEAIGLNKSNFLGF